MTDIENRVNLSSYKKEVKDVLKRLVKTMPAYKELRFFVECFINHYLPDLEKDSSDIVVIGSNIPEELVLVSGKMPYWILGGSRVSSIRSDAVHLSLRSLILMEISHTFSTAPKTEGCTMI